MEIQYGIVTAEHSYLYDSPGSDADRPEGGVTDEIFSGWAVCLFPETEENGRVRVITHYGYTGYVSCAELAVIRREELPGRQDKERFFRIGAREADLLSCPKVQGRILELLLKDALVELLGTAEGGWSLVRTAAGREGYVHTAFLRERLDADDYLMQYPFSGGETVSGGQDSPGDGKDYFLRRFLAQPPAEEELRAGLVISARAWLGTQYRWGGKSSQGLDCSGLVFMSYLENGVLIYRDASIEPGYPVHEIPREKIKPGDLLFFPGHVAMYLGEGRYIHSTGYEKTPCVTISSLNPEDEGFREDLAQKLIACGSVF